MSLQSQIASRNSVICTNASNIQYCTNSKDHVEKQGNFRRKISQSSRLDVVGTQRAYTQFSTVGQRVGPDHGIATPSFSFMRHFRASLSLHPLSNSFDNETTVAVPRLERRDREKISLWSSRFNRAQWQRTLLRYCHRCRRQTNLGRAVRGGEGGREGERNLVTR